MTASQLVITLIILHTFTVPVSVAMSSSGQGAPDISEDSAASMDQELQPAGDPAKSNDNNKESSSLDNESSCADTASCSAVVLYRPTALHAFRQESKTFTFADTQLVIKQKWEDIGVAAVVWDAAVVLAEYLEKSIDEFPLQGRRVIELGAGTGLVSMVAALLGAKVTATDRKLALQILEENIQDNFPCMKDTNAQCEQDKQRTANKIQVKELDWGQNHKEFAPIYDYILGADIIYIEETFEQFLETMRHLTGSSRKSRILLSCRIRYERDVRFLDMVRKNFIVKEIYHDDTRNIKVYVADPKR